MKKTYLSLVNPEIMEIRTFGVLLELLDLELNSEGEWTWQEVWFDYAGAAVFLFTARRKPL